MPRIKITNIEEVGFSEEMIGSIDGNPDRTNYHYVIVDGSYEEVRACFKRYPSKLKWMEDLVFYDAYDDHGIFCDLAFSASGINVGDELELI